MKHNRNDSTQNRAAAVCLLAAAGFILALAWDRCSTYWKRSSEPAVIHTLPLPEYYAQACERVGTVIRIDYPAKDYTAGTDVVKPAYVYLPYGYDRQKEYDVLYLIHGWMMQAQDYYADEFGIKTMFDHLIDEGKTKPFIAVSLTFDAENRPQSYERSVEELALFHYELREYALPYLEETLAVYKNSTGRGGYGKTRDHRAAAGFSMGGVTVWHQFIFNLDLIRSFIPISADSWINGQQSGLLHTDATVNRLVSSIRNGGFHADDYFIYAGEGTNDPMFEQMDAQLNEMKRRQEFSAENTVIGIKDEGYHDMVLVREQLYNALPLIFPGTAENP